MIMHNLILRCFYSCLLLILLTSFSLQAENFQGEQRVIDTGAPKQWVQLAYTTNALGYGVNNFLADNKVKVFWGGRVHVKQGAALNYQYNVVNFAKVLSFDCGVNVAWWQTSVKEEQFFTFSIFPVLRLNYLQTKFVDAYLYYTVAAPSYITKTVLDDIETGKHFTFMDNMGIGVFMGERKNYNLELKIGHYSNGGLFPPNWGVKVPITMNLGYAF